MSLLIAVLKCLFCWEDDEDRQIRHQLQRFPDQSYRVLHGDRNHDSVSRTNSTLLGQANFGSNTNSSRAHYVSYPSQTKPPCITNGQTIHQKLVPYNLSGGDVVKSSSRDAVSNTYASKQPSIPNKEKIPNSLAPIKLSGNQIVKSTDNSPVTGNNKNSSVPDASASKQPSIPGREKIVNSSASIKLSGNHIVKSTDSPPVTGNNKNSSVPDASASKQPSIPGREKIVNSSASIKLSGNHIVKPTDSSPVTGNNKNGSVASQSPLASLSSLKPYSAVSEPSLSSVSVNRSEIYEKLRRLRSSSVHGGEEGKKGTSSHNDERHSYDFPPVASDHLQSTTRFPVSLECFNSSASTFETGGFHSAQKTNQPKKSRSPKPPPISIKPTVSLVSSSSFHPQEKTPYVWVERDASSTYVFPEKIKSLIEKEIVPGVLKMPLSKSSYKDYFHALLFAEDCYLEKWDGFEMENMKVQLHEAAIYKRRGQITNFNIYDDKDEKVFVAFELDKIRERRPFLISRDFVSLQPANWKSKTFQSNLVLAEFGDDFYSHHHPDNKYDIKFSFNRVCLKRAHQAIAAASDSLFRNLLFPDAAPKYKLPSTQLLAKNKYELEAFAIQQILRLQGVPPYLVEKHFEEKQLSKTGVVVVEAILRILRADPSKRILLCAPVNNTCDMLMRGLRKEMSKSDMFRANAAFREVNGVPTDILPSCLYEEETECFSCPSLEELKKYKVILSTFMSSYRVYGEGIKAGHFSHIFLVDASSATEPETMVPLTNFVNDTTIVVVTGAPRNHSGWIRSKIARENGLMTSYFERLRNSGMYKKLDPKCIAQLDDNER